MSFSTEHNNGVVIEVITTVNIFVFVTNRPVLHCTNHNVAKYTDLICSSVLCCIDYAFIMLAKPSPYILKPGVIGVETLQIIYWTKKQVQNVCILCRSNTNKNTNTHTHKGASSYQTCVHFAAAARVFLKVNCCTIPALTTIGHQRGRVRKSFIRSDIQHSASQCLTISTCSSIVGHVIEEAGLPCAEQN